MKQEAGFLPGDAFIAGRYPKTISHPFLEIFPIVDIFMIQFCTILRFIWKLLEKCKVFIEISVDNLYGIQ